MSDLSSDKQSPYGLDEARRKLVSDLQAGMAAGTAPLSFPVVVRCKVPLIDLDPLTWLAGQKNARKVFWDSSVGHLTVAGLGAAFEVTAEGWYGFNDAWDRVNECIQASAEARFFTGMSFARTVNAPEWKGFPAIRFILPAVEVLRDQDGCWLVANAVRGRDGEPFCAQALEVLANMCHVEEVIDGDLEAGSREDIPDYEDWVCSAEAVREAFDKEGLEKVVLARRVVFALKGEVVAEAALRLWMDRHKTDHAFLFSADTSVFCGTSCEILYERRDNKVTARVVTGALKEHQFTAGALVEVFREFCRSYQVDGEKKHTRARRDQAEVVRISGGLMEGVTDRELVQALHPAAVTCGVPAEKARIFLQQYEVFDRGWFCGLTGFFSKTRTELAVAVKGCLSRPGELNVYALSSFVRDADPLVQWEEAGRDMKNILTVLDGG